MQQVKFATICNSHGKSELSKLQASKAPRGCVMHLYLSVAAAFCLLSFLAAEELKSCSVQGRASVSGGLVSTNEGP